MSHPSRGQFTSHVARAAFLATASLLMAEIAFAGTTYYVSASGDDGSAGISEEAPFATLQKAVATANGDPAAEAVVVLSDLVLEAPVEITGPYALRGRASDPAETIVSAKEKTTVTPLVKVSNPSAVVAHLTLSGGTYSNTSGGNLWLNGGGVVSNCVIRMGSGGTGKGGGVMNDNGIVTHCIIEEADLTGDGFGAGLYQIGANAVTEHSIIRNNVMNTYSGYGGGIASEGGVIRHCVITNNVTRHELGHGGEGGGIWAKSTVIDHCLIARNRGGQGGGGVILKGGANAISNCTIVFNTSTSGSSGISGGNTRSTFADSIVLGNTFTLGDAEESPEWAYMTNLSTTNILTRPPLGDDPVEGDVAFIDADGGDFRLSASSVAVGRGIGGGDLGCFPFPRDRFSVGLPSMPSKALPTGRRRFEARALNGQGTPLYRWRLDDLLSGAEGAWTDYGEAAYEPELRAGHWRLVVEAKDETGETASFSRSFYVGAQRVYLVPAGTEGNGPVAPYGAKETAANDIQEAILYCTDGTELVVSDGDYGVTRELSVPAKVLIRSENGPEKTSIYRAAPYGKGIEMRVVRLHGRGATLSGFAVTNGYFASTSHGMKYGANVLLYQKDVVTNCIIARAKMPIGQFSSAAIASVGGSILDSVIRQNEGGGGYGGGVSLRKGASMADCTVTNHYNGNNYYTSGLGVNAENALIVRCVIRDNKTSQGIGGGFAGGISLAHSEIRDSLIADNSSGKNGGGGIATSGASKIVNCTIANNESAGHSGGMKAAGTLTVVNTLFYGNSSAKPSASPGEPNWMGLENANCSVSHIAAPTPEAAIGTLPVLLSTSPFVDAGNGDYTLAIGTPCRNGGENGDRLPTELDLAGNPRIAEETIDIGAYEYQLASDLSCSFLVSGYDTAAGEVILKASVDGADLEGLQYRWGIAPAAGEPVYSWSYWEEVDSHSVVLEPGRYLFRLEVRNARGQAACASDDTVYRVVARNVYLVPPAAAVGEPRYPYDSWDHAATNIPMALSAAGNGTTILATNGHYGVTSSAILDKAIRLVSVNGPEVTSIYRALPRNDSQPAYRPVTMTGPGAFFGGFTVSNGFIGTTVFNGAALFCQDSTVSNCVFRENVLNPTSLGATVMNIDGLVTHCILRDNTGGGADGYGVYQMGGKARTDHCEFFHNTATVYYCCGSVVMYGGVLSDCVITGNVVAARGGQSVGVRMDGGLAYNCLIAWNKAGFGAGGAYVQNGALVNCTIVSNSVHGTESTRAGGVVFAGNQSSRIGVTNCIIYGNFNAHSEGTIINGMESARANMVPVSLSHTLLENWREIDPDAVGCQTGDPRFKDFEGRDWHLAGDSPCRDAGLTLGHMLEDQDLEGRPRVIHRDLVDLGCYEAFPVLTHTLLIVR